MLMQDLPAALVDNPSCCSDLFVIVRSDVFHKEIHEAPFLLEETDESHHLGLGLVCSRGWRLGRHRSDSSLGDFLRFRQKGKRQNYDRQHESKRRNGDRVSAHGRDQQEAVQHGKEHCGDR